MQRKERKTINDLFTYLFLAAEFWSKKNLDIYTREEKKRTIIIKRVLKVIYICARAYR